jgi:hypothetical protein
MANFNYWTKLAVVCATATQVGVASVLQNEGIGVDISNDARIQEFYAMMQCRDARDQEFYVRIQEMTQYLNRRAQEIDNAIQICMDALRPILLNQEERPAPRTNNTDRSAAR